MSNCVVGLRRLRASSRDGSGVVNRPPSPLNMLLSRHTRRREFISLVGGTAAAWPLAATAQTPERIRLIGMLAGINDPDIKAFQQELEKRGWSEGRNIHIESRYAPAGTQAQALAKELVAMNPR